MYQPELDARTLGIEPREWSEERVVAAIQNRPLVIVPVPLLTPGLSSMWLTLVTDIDNRSGRNLVDSMTNEVIVEDDAITRVVPFERTPYDEAVRQALAERAQDRRA